MNQDELPQVPTKTAEEVARDARYQDQLRKLQQEVLAVKEAEMRDKTVEEEWSEIILLQGMLVDRIDRLVMRAGCKTRRELMLRLSGHRQPDSDVERVSSWQDGTREKE